MSALSSFIRGGMLALTLTAIACGGMHGDNDGIAQVQSGHSAIRAGVDLTNAGLASVKSGHVSDGLSSIEDGMNMARHGAESMRSGHGMMAGSMGMMGDCAMPSNAMADVDAALGMIQDGHDVIAQQKSTDDMNRGLQTCEAGVRATGMPMDDMDRWMICMNHRP